MIWPQITIQWGSDGGGSWTRKSKCLKGNVPFLGVWGDLGPKTHRNHPNLAESLLSNSTHTEQSLQTSPLVRGSLRLQQNLDAAWMPTEHNWTILEGRAHYRLHRRLVFQLGKRAFQGSFPCLAGQPAPGQRKLPNSQLDSSLSRETALCKVASLGSKWFKVHTLPVLHDIHIAAGTITHLCRGQTLRPRLSGRWMTGRSRVVYVLLLKAPQNRNI